MAPAPLSGNAVTSTTAARAGASSTEVRSSSPAAPWPTIPRQRGRRAHRRRRLRPPWPAPSSPEARQGTAREPSPTTDTTCPMMGRADSPPANNSQSGVDPELGPLQNNGGPTETQAPGPDQPGTRPDPYVRPFVDGVISVPQNDQRGVARPQAMSCDIGAVEPVLPLAITSPDSATATAGAPFSFTVTTSGTPCAQAVHDRHPSQGPHIRQPVPHRPHLRHTRQPGPRASLPPHHVATFGQGSSKQVVTQAFTLTVDPDEG